MGGIPFQGTSGNLGDITTLGEVKTAPSRTNIGYIDIVCEKDSGAITGTPDIRQVDGTGDFQARVGIDTFLDTEVFNYGAQNTAKHTYTNTTMTLAWGAGALQTNSGSIVTASTGLKFSTYREFPITGPSDIWFEMSGSFTGTWGATNTTIDFGAFIPGAALPFTPADGAYFRANSSGLFAVTNYNGTETVSPVLLASYGGAAWTPTIGKAHIFSIGLSWRGVEFYIDEVLEYILPAPTTAGAPLLSGSVPFALRHVIGGTAASAVISFNLATYTISYSGIPLIKEWSQICAGMGLTGYQGTSGNTMGSTASIANSSVPAAGNGSNTAALVAGLGGIGQMNATASAATDLIATSYQVSAGTAVITGRHLYITGVNISAINYGATVAGTPTTLHWFLCFGHTAVSLATAESQNTKAPRRISLGFLSVAVGAAAGAPYGNGNPLTAQFLTPIVVNPGEYVASVVRQIIGTATGSQTILFSVQFDCYWE
jgi:hypothetical protein